MGEDKRKRRIWRWSLIVLAVALGGDHAHAPTRLASPTVASSTAAAPTTPAAAPASPATATR